MSEPPIAIIKLRDRISKDLNAEVEIDASEGSRQYTLWVVSGTFSKLSHLQRQDLVWSLVDEVCSREESMMIMLIMTYAPGEMAEFVDALGSKT